MIGTTSQTEDIGREMMLEEGRSSSAFTRIATGSRETSPSASDDARAETLADALDRLYRAFFLRLARRTMWKFHLSQEDACEIVHDAFLVALAKFDTNVDRAGWLYRTVDNLALNWRRKIDRRARLTAKWVPRAARAKEEGGQS